MDHVTLKVPKYVLVIAMLILVGSALGAVGFLLGRDSVSQADVRNPSRADVAASYRKGFVAGREAGAPKRTYAEGLADGRRSGERKGYRDGAAAALGGDRFDLAPGAYYIVRFADGDHGAPLELERSAAVVPGRAYEICNTDEICFRQ